MARQWVKPGRKKCTNEKCKRPAVIGERYCGECKADLIAKAQEDGILERRPMLDGYRGRYSKEIRIEE